MPRAAKGARLWADKASGLWYIRDGTTKRGTGCSLADTAGAEAALSRYIATKYQPPTDNRADKLSVADVLVFYSRAKQGEHRSKSTLYAIEALDAWWGEKKIAEIKTSTCKAYVAHRMSQPIRQAKTEEAKKRTVKEGTARRELAILQSALNTYHKETPLQALPQVTLPRPSKSRTRFLSRNEVARLLWATRKMEDQDGARAIRRFVLIGLYTGTRSGALRSLGWMPNTEGGWVDVEKSVFHRQPDGEVATKKRKPSARIPDRLAGSLRRWRTADLEPAEREDGTTPDPIPFVIHYRGFVVEKQRKSWARACKLAGLDASVTPHILRHTAVTWMMLAGNDMYDVASYVGMSVKMVEEVYGHHHPDHQRKLASRIGRR